MEDTSKTKAMKIKKRIKINNSFSIDRTYNKLEERLNISIETFSQKLEIKETNRRATRYPL